MGSSGSSKHFLSLPLSTFSPPHGKEGKPSHPVIKSVAKNPFLLLRRLKIRCFVNPTQIATTVTTWIKFLNLF